MLSSAVAAAVDGELHGPDVEVEGCSIDSRTLAAGQMFVAVVAVRDGHDFLGAAAAEGAAAFLVSDESALPSGATYIRVTDTGKALSQLGAAARDELSDRVVGITGSVGKTSCKDLAAAALATSFNVTASERSFNNELGVPITLFNAPADVEVAVIEMGSRGAGHLTELCEVARPRVGVVTEVGAAHTEMFGKIEDVIEAKAELVQALPESGAAILKADAEHAWMMAGMTEAQVLTFGIEAGDVRATGVRLDDGLRPSFRLESPWGSAAVELQARGVHNVANATAAAAAALMLDADMDGIAAGMAEATLSPDRMDLLHVPSGARILNDAYNANPLSVEAALHSLAALPAERRIAVLGVMAELGEHHESEHRAMAELADDLGIDVIAVAEPAYGVKPVADVDGAQAALGELGPGDAVLVKGSRVVGLERLVKRLAG